MAGARCSARSYGKSDPIVPAAGNVVAAHAEQARLMVAPSRPVMRSTVILDPVRRSD